MSATCEGPGCGIGDASTPRYRRVLWVALAINVLMFAVEIVGGVSAFTAEWGARIEVDLSARQALTLGYRWKHTPNGTTTDENPGMDSRLLTAALQRQHPALDTLQHSIPPAVLLLEVALHAEDQQEAEPTISHLFFTV